MLTTKMIEAMEESGGLRSKFRASAVTMAETGLFTVGDVAEWAGLFDGFDLMLIAALDRVAETPEERKDAHDA